MPRNEAFKKTNTIQCLKHDLEYVEYEEICKLPLEVCEAIASLAKKSVNLNNTSKPGKVLVDELNNCGITGQKFRTYLKDALSSRVKRHIYYKPQLKIGVLIANDAYAHLSPLLAPSGDCETIKSDLMSAGFIVIIVKNSKANELKAIIEAVFKVVPENSYCFIFYAGHGCELSNTKFMLDITCPKEDISINSCITENYVLQEVSKCKPELCVLIMDMCRICLDRVINPQIYNSLSQIEIYDPRNINNLLIGYSTQAFYSAYEMIQLEVSNSLDSNLSYHLKSSDLDRANPQSSQYVNAFCSHFKEDLDVNKLLDKVHGDLEKGKKVQKAIKVQCGTAKRSFYDPIKGDPMECLNKLREVCKDYDNCCNVFYQRTCN